MKIKTAEFVLSAARLEQLPRDGLPEIALAGRSNVGKSSLLNKLTGRKRLARISKTPGKTRELNLYRVDSKLVIVDLPGYGYAKVPDAVKRKWGDLIESYLHAREELAGIVHLVDSRHPPTRDDVHMHEWVKHYDVLALIAATKIDKIPKMKRAGVARTIEEILEPAPGTPIVLFSATSGEGAREIWGWVREVTGAI